MSDAVVLPAWGRRRPVVLGFSGARRHEETEEDLQQRKRDKERFCVCLGTHFVSVVNIVSMLLHVPFGRYVCLDSSEFMSTCLIVWQFNKLFR